jgi:predicted HNH restriction endonuclease
MPSLTFYNAKKLAAETAIQKLSDLIEAPSVRDIIVVVKSLEIMDDEAHVAGYDALVTKLVNKATEVMNSNLSDDDMMYVVRAISYGSIPFGSEEWWKLRHKDSENVNIHGEVEVGLRTLESFGEVTLETFYGDAA